MEIDYQNSCQSHFSSEVFQERAFKQMLAISYLVSYLVYRHASRL